MSATASLWVFFALVFGIVVVPGVDMAFVVGSALAGGRRAGFAAVAGIVAGAVCHVAMAALGVTMLVRLVPGLLQAVMLLGALYLGWIGVAILRHRPDPGGDEAPPPMRRAHAAVFRRGALTNLLNPKAYLFMLAVFPQFVLPGRGPVWSQAVVLWLIIAATQVGVYGALAWSASVAGTRLARRPRLARAACIAVGVLLLGIAAFTLVEGVRGGHLDVP